ncbi:MAG: ABA4-like family protein [Hyphomonadaceae bacterium]
MYDAVFLAIHLIVAPAWVLLAFAPRWPGTQAYAHTALIPLGLGGAYGAFLCAALMFGASAEGAGIGSIAGVSALFSHPVGVLTGWTHYLIFDLFVGAWISRDALRRGMAYALVIPCLALTLFFGPIGLLSYLVIRQATGKAGFSLSET